jgi:hypothetical protein
LQLSNEQLNSEILAEGVFALFLDKKPCLKVEICGFTFCGILSCAEPAFQYLFTMKILLIILCVGAIIWLSMARKKIDQEEAVALKTPGTAARLRENFGTVVELVLQDPNHSIALERSYDESIRFKNNSGQELFMSYSALGGSQLRVAVIQNSSVLKEFKFDKSKSSSQIYQEISYYFD